MAAFRDTFRQIVERMFGRSSRLSKPVVRLFVAQGPSQLLMCDAVAQFLDDLPEGVAAQNICLLFGKYAFAESSGISAALKTVAKSSTWNRVIDLFDVEDALWRDVDADFPSVLAEIRRRIGIDDLDELYLARNWQITNELIGAAFPEAEGYIYGDGLGNIDSVRLPTYKIATTAFAVLPDFNILMDEESSMTPSNTKLRIVPRLYYLRAIERAAAEISQVLPANMDPEGLKNAALVLTSTLAEAQLLSFEDEVQLVIDLVIPRLAGIDRVYVKPHPRETAGQAAEVVRRLNEERHCEAFLFKQENEAGLRYLPLEMVVSRGMFKTIITPIGSYASIITPWLLDVVVDLPSVAEIVARTECDTDRFRNLVNGFLELWEYREKLQLWDGRSVVWTRNAKNPEAYGHLKNLDREKRWRAELVFTNQANFPPTVEVEKNEATAV